jgi:DNA-binding response OmpR family regulator
LVLFASAVRTRAFVHFEHNRGTYLSSVTYLAGRTCNEAATGSGKVDDVVTILVIEDDQLIQAMIEEALSEGGFEATVTASGDAAITLLHANKFQYRAVVTDINLIGRFDGWEVARTAREADPTIPVIYMTGTHGEEWAFKGVPNSVLLKKPFAPAQLVTALSNLLNATSPPAAPTA